MTMELQYTFGAVVDRPLPETRQLVVALLEKSR